MGEKITNVQDHYSMLTLLKAVRPSIRKKMLLQKVDTFEKAINVLLSEEQANSDARQCSGSSSEPPDAEVFATSAYKRDQRSERQSFSTNSNMPEPGYVCSRCRAVGKHFSVNCPAIAENVQIVTKLDTTHQLAEKVLTDQEMPQAQVQVMPMPSERMLNVYPLMTWQCLMPNKLKKLKTMV